MITVTTWLWGNKYSKVDVERLRRGVEKHLLLPHRFICISDRILDSYSFPIPEQDKALLRRPGCLARLRLFDPEFQKALGATEKIVNLDLDSVVTGSLDEVFKREEDFVILSGANAANPCPFNGSVFMLNKGAHPEVFYDFSEAALTGVPYYEFADDQAWLHHKLPNAATWQVATSGIYAFEKPGWPKTPNNDLPNNAALVVFPGWRSPEKFQHLDWVYRNWTLLFSSPGI
jgi:hypothetical protein